MGLVKKRQRPQLRIKVEGRLSGKMKSKDRDMVVGGGGRGAGG